MERSKKGEKEKGLIKELKKKNVSKKKGMELEMEGVTGYEAIAINAKNRIRKYEEEQKEKLTESEEYKSTPQKSKKTYIRELNHVIENSDV